MKKISVHWVGEPAPPEDSDPTIDTWSHGISINGQWVRTVFPDDQSQQDSEHDHG